MDTLMDFIMKTYQSSKRYRAEKLDCGLVPFHQLYIYRICRHPGGSQDWLARALCISKSNVTRQLTTLEQAGFVTRSPDPVSYTHLFRKSFGDPRGRNLP